MLLSLYNKECELMVHLVSKSQGANSIACKKEEMITPITANMWSEPHNLS